MKNRYRLVRRAYGIYYSLDKENGRKESLETTNKIEAEKLLSAKNDTIQQPALNKGMAKVYLSAASPEFASRTWEDVMDHYVKSGVESTRDRKERAFRSRPFAALKMTKLLDTEAIHLLNAIEHKQAGNSTHHYLRRLHNYALHLGWLISPVMAEAAWPALRKKKFTAITAEEHERILAKERNQERKLYYQMLWETGGSQSDIAGLSWKQIDLAKGVIRFNRRKLMGKDGGSSFLRIGPRLSALLAQLPATGDLFPTLKPEESKHRSTEFRRRCMMLAAKWHTYQVLTKRSERMRDLLKTKLHDAARASHIWWGVSVENKKHGIPRIGHLQGAPAAVRFLSVEPLIEDVGKINLRGLHWVIVGGESGHGARPIQPEWVKSIRDQCAKAKVPFFFKQWGGVRKHETGRTLDGRTYSEFPETVDHPVSTADERRAVLKELETSFAPA